MKTYLAVVSIACTVLAGLWFTWLLLSPGNGDPTWPMLILGLGLSFWLVHKRLSEKR